MIMNKVECQIVQRVKLNYNRYINHKCNDNIAEWLECWSCV